MRQFLLPAIVLSTTFLLSAQPPAAMTLTIAGFSDCGHIDVRFSQAAPGAAPGGGTSPAMSWSNAPVGTQSFLLNVHDTDTVRNKTTDHQAHWVLWNIPATATGLPEGVPGGSQLPQGPCTAVRAHRPTVHSTITCSISTPSISGLDVKPSGDAFDTRANVMKAIQGHILAKAIYWGLFRRLL